MFSTYGMETYCCFHDVWSLKIHTYIYMYTYTDINHFFVTEERISFGL